MRLNVLNERRETDYIHSLWDTRQAVSLIRLEKLGGSQGVSCRSCPNGSYDGSTKDSIPVLVARLTFSVPMNNRCSTAWAIPGMSFESLKLPTLTSRAALALSVLGSCINSTSRRFCRVRILYDRSSRAGLSRSSIRGRVARLSGSDILNGGDVDKRCREENERRGGARDKARRGSSRREG